ncbi:unnamed protein product, partial [Aphanomyces euteiches]
MYFEGCRDVTQELANRIAFGEEGCRSVRFENGQYSCLDCWPSLDDAEASRKPVESLYEDVPVVFRHWVNQNEDEEVMNLADAHEKNLRHALYVEVFYAARQID